MITIFSSIWLGQPSVSNRVHKRETGWMFSWLKRHNHQIKSEVSQAGKQRTNETDQNSERCNHVEWNWCDQSLSGCMRSHHFVTSGDWQTFIHASSPRINIQPELAQQKPDPIKTLPGIRINSNWKQRRGRKRRSKSRSEGGRLRVKQVAQNFLEDLCNRHRRPADASGTRISFLIANIPFISSP